MANKISLRLGLTSALLAAILLGACGGTDSTPAPLSKFVVFGASLSDTGNVFAATSGSTPGASPSYYGGRWSNGTLWVENLASRYGMQVTPSALGGTNYAYGGAKTCNISGVTSNVPDMCTQATQYLTAVGNAAGGNIFYVIDATAVGNEILAVLGSGGSIPLTQATTTAPANVDSIMQRLYNAGARRFLVMNVPDVGVTPLVQGYGATAAASASAMSVAYNSALSGKVTAFKAARPDASVVLFDTYSFSADLRARPSSYGLTNTSTPCQNSGVICASPDTYMYWDSFHPTRVMGQFLTTAVANAL